ncbi:Thiamine pyrophosphokinase [bioreactor metagenome]|uniref:Thiamine pyrophosphokinase n=1 Tax=bioreactor metagenome TaxID=1076179 RepID=A0A644YGP0_9ZZZZ
MSDSRVCVILAAMGLRDEEANEIAALENPYIICADAGYAHAARCGIVPALILGDFDSYDGNAETLCGAVETFPVEKDDTDTMLAVKEGLAAGCRDFRIYGALGGRLDHTMANIVALRYLLDHGASGWLISSDNCVTMIENDTIVVKKDPCFPNASIFCYGPPAKGVTIRGCQYPLTDYTLDEHFPLGVSNHVMENEGSFTVKEGTLLVILSA